MVEDVGWFGDLEGMSVERFSECIIKMYESERMGEVWGSSTASA